MVTPRTKDRDKTKQLNAKKMKKSGEKDSSKPSKKVRTKMRGYWLKLAQKQREHVSEKTIAENLLKVPRPNIKAKEMAAHMLILRISEQICGATNPTNPAKSFQSKKDDSTFKGVDNWKVDNPD